MTEGYIKLYRKMLDNGWLRNHELLAFWVWCMLKASHKDCVVMVGFQKVELKAGEFIFGRKKAAEELDLSEQQIRTCVDSMRKRQNLTIKSTNKYSIISLINWHTYQGQQNEINQQPNKPITSKQPATNHKQECKEGEEWEEKEFKVPSFSKESFKKKKNKGENGTIPYQVIIDDLNIKAKTHYRVTDDVKELINGRWNDGYRLEDFLKVHENMSTKWLKNPEMNQYLRPSTLYRKTKFQNYLNMKIGLYDKGVVSSQTERGMNAIQEWLDEKEAEDQAKSEQN